MISNDLLRKAMRAEYTLLRTPLAVLDEQIVSRYTPRGSRVQTSLARTIGVLDALADRLLTEDAEPVLADQEGPAAPPEPTSPEPTSPAPSAAATAPRPAPRRAPAAADAASPDAGTPEPLPEPEQEQVEELAEDILDAEEEQTFTGELAEDDELRRMQAELRAKHTVEEREESS